MNKFEQHEAALKIDGYYLSISNTTNVVEQFERAKRECLYHLRQRLEHVEAMTLADFLVARKPLND